MIKDFFGVNFVRVGESSRLWFSHIDIQERFFSGLRGSQGSQFKLKMYASAAAPFRTMYANTRDLRISENEEFSEGRKRKLLHDLDYLMAALYSASTEDTRKVRDWIAYQINSLCFDGFTTLTPYSLPKETRLALTALVCGVPHYLDIVRERYDGTDLARGLNKAPIHVTFEDMLVPDNYLKRDEISQIKALDLAITLLTRYVLKDEAQQAELYKLIGIDNSMGKVEDTHLQELTEWLKVQEEKTQPCGD